MRDQWLELITGTLVLIVAVGFAVFGLNRAGVASAPDGYVLSASFRSVEGIGVGTDVRMAGVKVGTVTGLTLNPDTLRTDAVISVLDAIEIPDDSAILISSEGLLGGSFVEVQPGGSPFAMGDGDEFVDTQGAVSLITLLMKFVGGGS